jgi:hypothetical protein
MNSQFGSDEDRKCNKKSDMRFDVVKEGNPTDGSARGAKDGEEQQRQPCNQRHNEQSAMQEFQVISSEMRRPKELEDWTTQYQREIEIGFRHGVYALPRANLSYSSRVVC